MDKEIDNWLNQIKNATGNEQKELFVRYCITLIQLKEEGKLSEEEASYKMVNAIQSDNLTDSPECAAIFDMAGVTEFPRTTSYRQPIGKWNAKMADQIKHKEWEELVNVIKNAKTSLNM